MSSLNFRIDYREVQQSIGDIRKKLDNPRSMMQEIGDIIVEDIKHRIINTKTSPEDIAWAPWAPGTKKAREKKGNAALGLLYDTGTLLNSITSQVIGGHNTLQVGTNVKYAGWLNEGTEKMPARPFLGISKRAQESIDEAIHLYLGQPK